MFIRGGDYDLAHKWFTNGAWSGWESQGGYLTTDPAVTSSGPDRLLIFARGGEGNLWNTWYNHGWAGSWGDLAGVLAANAPVTVTSRAIDAVDVFVIGKDDFTLFQRAYDCWNGGWKDFQAIDGFSDHAISAAAWEPTKQLELFDNDSGTFYHRSSGDAGERRVRLLHPDIADVDANAQGDRGASSCSSTRMRFGAATPATFQALHARIQPRQVPEIL